MKTYVANDFEESKQKFIEFLKTQDGFKDYDYDGSGLSNLLDILMYAYQHHSFLSNMSLNELFLMRTQIKENAYSISKSHGYLPHRKRNAIGRVTLSLKSDKQPAGGEVVYVPKYTKFQGKNGNGTFNFITKNDYVLDTGNTYSQTIDIFQSEHNTKEVVYDGSNIILYEGDDITNDFFTVYVDDVEWTQYENNLMIDGSSEMYFLEYTSDGKLELSFGNSQFGKSPVVGSNINIVYGITKGEVANSAGSFVLAETLLDSQSNSYVTADFDLTVVNTGYDGEDGESIESVQIHAPKFYETQERCVNIADYKNMLSVFNYIKNVNVWNGADDENNPIYGKVFVCVKPSGTEDYLSEAQKTEISDFLKKYMVLSINPLIKDPIYVNVDIDSLVRYTSRTSVPVSTMDSDIRATIHEYFDSGIDYFTPILRYSRLIREIDDVEGVSNNISKLNPYITIQKSPTNHYLFSIYNTVDENSVSFQNVNNEEIVDDGNGNLVNTENNDVVGSIDYEKGIFKFKSELYESTDIRFDTKDEDIFVRFNVMVKVGSINTRFERI